MSGRRARAYLRGEEWFVGAVEHLHGLWDGLWLGVLDQDDLGRVDERYYDDAGMYTARAWNESGLRPWEDELVQRFVPPGGAVTVFGAGGGREVLALLADGVDATGFEPHPQLARVGAAFTAEIGEGPRVHHSPRNEWPSEAPSADMVLFGWGAYMLVPGRSLRVRLLRAATGTLSERGTVVVSFFALPVDRRRFRTAHAVARRLRRLRGASPAEFGDSLEPNYAHHFSRSQIAEEFAAAGLRLEAAGRAEQHYGWAVGRPPAADEGVTS